MRDDRFFLPWNHSWDDMDPARHPFDRDRVAEVVRALAPAADVPTPRPPYADHDGYRAWISGAAGKWPQAMTDALADHYGPWVVGWRWSTGEGDIDGGVVASWCCESHSIKDRDTTLGAVTQALLEWRDWLERLAGWYARFLPLPAGADEETLLELWERAVALLITHAVDWTACESGWYKTAQEALKWFLEAADVPSSRHQELIEHAMGGRFHSWTIPTLPAVTAAAETMAADLTRRA